MRRFVSLLALVAPTVTSVAGAQGAYDLEIREVEGDLYATLHAKDAELSEILRDIAARTHKELVGLERLERLDRITATLDNRPLTQVVFTLAGCAGARALLNSTSIELMTDLGGGASADELHEQAMVTYVRALRAHPDHPQGAQAELALGAIQEEHGNLRAAVGHYELLVRNHPQADEVPEGLWRAGKLLEQLDDWTGAGQKFTTLANLRVEHSYSSRARLELAHCLVQTGDPRQSMLLLDALDHLYPTTDSSETKARLFVRALAQLGIGRHGDALRTLTRADEMGFDPAWEAEATELRAEAFDHFGRTSEAARAWLHLSQIADASGGKRRERALINAARLSIDSGDAIAVLMIERAAAGSSAAEKIAPFAEQARRALGLITSSGSAALRSALEQAESLLTAHLPRQAVQTLQRAWLARKGLEQGELAELAVLYARALDAESGLEVAIDFIQRTEGELHSDETRRELCRIAGELYQKHERFEEAARAFGGELP